MNQKQKKDIKLYFKEKFADTLHKNLENGHKLSSFTLNPFLVTAFSKGIFGDATPENVAKSLLYPRVFGTSTTTTLGTRLQKFAVRMGAQASSTAGMDIEFDDKKDGGRVISQLKAGPNTINSGDVDPMVEKFKQAYRLLRQNGVEKMPTFALGVLYGSKEEVSTHYRNIEASSVGSQLEVPIYIGQNFWHRLTGDKNFYFDLITIFFELFEQEDYSKLFEGNIKKLSIEVNKKYFTKGKFDIKKI